MMRPRRAWRIPALSLLLLALLLSACSGNRSASKDSDTGEDDEAALEAKVRKGVKPAADAEAAVFETDFGRIVIELYPNLAPRMVERFKQLIKEGFYTGTTFHRVNPQLGIIQGGDPLSKDDNPANDGTGDSPYPNVPGEFSDVPYERGIVGAARKGGGMGMTEAQARDTANCQFYITLKRVQAFDTRYTVFGRVIEGLNTADVIAGAPTDQASERPADKIVIKNATLEPRSNFGK
jgi:cyclophilin family peptidyl-prolyl cis-trans isomerase